jgi:hypothetical protein
LIEFCRGLNCPGCQTHQRDIERHVDEFRGIGVETIAISGDTPPAAVKRRGFAVHDDLPSAPSRSSMSVASLTFPHAYGTAAVIYFRLGTGPGARREGGPST